jgi:hypothetical protein
MEKYFLVTVVIKDVNEKGKTTKTTEQYLTLITGCTEAEAAVVKKFVDEGSNLDYEVKSVKSTNILSVIE